MGLGRPPHAEVTRSSIVTGSAGTMFEARSGQIDCGPIMILTG
jgi:hypothetical protein